MTTVTIYSPASPATPLHALNLRFAEAAAGAPGASRIEMPAVALPESVNRILAMDAVARRTHLPIMTTTDFLPARLGAGPSWHGYPQASGDLKFVAKLYDVGFGLYVMNPRVAGPDDLRGRRIGAPARPSAVRLLAETLLGDGWGVIDDVELVDMTPPEAVAALKSGAIDATAWNLALPTGSAFRPILPIEGGRYLGVDEAALARLHDANSFRLGFVDMPGGGTPLLSFAQSLAAWDATPPETVNALLVGVERFAAGAPALPGDAAAMIDWPGLAAAHIHPTALEFYCNRGLAPT